MTTPTEVPGAAALQEIEQAFAACGAPVQIELAHLADPAIGALLTGRGYRLISFENVLGHALKGQQDRVTPPGIEVRPSGEDEFGAWLDVVVDGHLHPDTQGMPSHEELPREAVERVERDLATAAGARRYIALHDGIIAGGAFVRITAPAALRPGCAPRVRRDANVVP